MENGFFCHTARGKNVRKFRKFRFLNFGHTIELLVTIFVKTEGHIPKSSESSESSDSSILVTQIELLVTIFMKKWGHTSDSIGDLVTFFTNQGFLYTRYAPTVVLASLERPRLAGAPLEIINTGQK